MSSIPPHYETIHQLLQNQSFSIDEYQREYKWEQKYIVRPTNIKRTEVKDDKGKITQEGTRRLFRRNRANGGSKRYGGITETKRLQENFAQNCLPTCLLDGEVPDYDDFLAERRQLMAIRIKE